MNGYTSFAIFSQIILSTCLFLGVESTRNPLSNIKVPFLSKLKKKQYTPLVFFTFPKGYVDECDEMESVVSEVERELGVRVERLDIARDSAAQATMQLLTSQQGPPFLYHRESCQVIHGVSQARANQNSPAKPEVIDKARVRAWAKGRYLPPPGVKLGATTKKPGKAPVVISQEDNALDQAELIKESSLTPEQLEGKRAMEERTAAAINN
mmetsp:Transcript_9221/g.19355  ORF Transcript_9221/g.19355 Transcript_9221/m.19355 type:complete len:210 (+) Transcript_9221:108-737(+)|eukprot:CAMPEP_0201238256 /NCGR_PEP_ID=MMETSP0852-20130820/17217_1 /ASSEMBLY_ACC=CAM_ASM_000632 /TAXON_ID=183588 /ORGANISM="Pseudo-nitzschia fraudulenta, Strain WWA7" /LENGTH=209 /DNA_ID=CAMNT_0047533019 /DNA_START=49 /DNA_END=678 /DNA_ORIENTATION=+